MWSFGATLYMAVEAGTPFRTCELDGGAGGGAARATARAEAGGRPEPVLRGLLRKDPRARLSAERTSKMLEDVRCFSAA
ncbi:hypothetical protein GCM10018952_28830 [Streptosporangium vulgare]